MIVISKKKFYVIICFLMCFICLLIFFDKGKTSVFAKKPVGKIVLDAGHGFPDGGAIGMNASIESTLNIKVTRLVKKKLEKNGYAVIMTRKGEDATTKEGKTISQKKVNDMKNRLRIINSSNADMLVSIHMNTFTDSRYRGAQVLYSLNFRESESLGKSIQRELVKLPENKSKREAVCAPNSLYLMKNATIPAVIVECGFLSNFQEEQNLNTYEYQNKLASAICEGIVKYYKNAELRMQNAK